jgi:hypothetical protein
MLPRSRALPGNALEGRLCLTAPFVSRPGFEAEPRAQCVPGQSPGTSHSGTAFNRCTRTRQSAQPRSGDIVWPGAQAPGSDESIRKPRRGDINRSLPRPRHGVQPTAPAKSCVPVCRPSGAWALRPRDQWLTPLAKLFRPSRAGATPGTGSGSDFQLSFPAGMTIFCAACARLHHSRSAAVAVQITSLRAPCEGK